MDRFIPTPEIGRRVDELVANFGAQRKPFERRWYNNNFFDDGFHYRFVSRTTGRVMDLSASSDTFIPYRAIPKASRQIRGIVNLLLAGEPQAVVYPERVMQSNYPDLQQFQQAEKQAADNAKQIGNWIEWAWNKYDIKRLLTNMGILTSKHGVSYLQIWPDAVKEDIRFSVYDAFDVYCKGNGNEIYESPAIIKVVPTPIEEIKANEDYDPMAVAKINPDNKYAASEIKEAYMMSRFGMNRDTGTLLLKEAFFKEYVSNENRARIKADLKGEYDKKDGDPIIRQVFSVAGMTLKDTYTTFPEYPFVDLRFEPGYVHQVPLIERFISANKSLDAVMSRIERYIGTQIVGVYMKRRGENYRINNIAGGAEVEYDTTPPAQMPLSPMPAFVFDFIGELNSIIEEQGASTSALNQLPPGVKSGVAIEGLKATEYSNLKIASDQLKNTAKRIAERMIELGSKYFITPKTISFMQNDKPTYFDIIGERGMKAYQKLAKKKGSTVQVPNATVIKKDYQVVIETQSGMGFTEEGKRTTMMQLIDYMTKLATEQIIPPEALAVVIRKFLNTFQFGSTAEFMDAMEGNPQFGAMEANQQTKLKTALLQALKDAGEVGKEASDKRIAENKIGFVQVLKDLGVTMPKSEVADNPELAPIPYKDAPEDIKRQMEAKAGLTPSKEISPAGTDQVIKQKSLEQSAMQSQNQTALEVAKFKQSGDQAIAQNDLQKQQLKQKGGQNATNQSRSQSAR